VKKKAGLCLLRLYRKYPDIIPGKDWAQNIIAVLDDGNLGVVHTAACLITSLAQAYPEAYSSSVTKAIMKLNAVIF
jgi:AP-2 complex subunit alpha